jgi:hypothetical protein
MMAKYLPMSSKDQMANRKILFVTDENTKCQ